MSGRIKNPVLIDPSCTRKSVHAVDIFASSSGREFASASEPGKQGAIPVGRGTRVW